MQVDVFDQTDSHFTCGNMRTIRYAKGLLLIAASVYAYAQYSTFKYVPSSYMTLKSAPLCVELGTKDITPSSAVIKVHDTRLKLRMKVFFSGLI